VGRGGRGDGGGKKSAYTQEGGYWESVCKKKKLRAVEQKPLLKYQMGGGGKTSGRCTNVKEKSGQWQQGKGKKKAWGKVKGKEKKKRNK